MQCGYAQEPTDSAGGIIPACRRLVQPQLILPQMPHMTTFPGRAPGTMLTATDIGTAPAARATYH